MKRSESSNRIAIFTLALALAALCGLELATVRPALAAAPPTGRVNGLLEFHCSEGPIAESLEVLPSGGEALDLEMAAAFGEELTRHRYSVVSGANLVIGIATRREDGRIDYGPGTLGKLRGGKGGVEMQMNVWSSGEDSLLVRRAARREREEPKLIIVATLRNRETGKIHWRGRASGPIGNAQPRAIGLALVPPLVSAFGCPVAIDDINLPTH